MDRRFLILGGLTLLSLLWLVGRSQCGSELGVDLGPDATVLDSVAQLQVLGGAAEDMEQGDRVISMAGRPVHSLAEAGDTLRSLEPGFVVESDSGRTQIIRLVLIMERYRFRFTEVIRPDDFEERGLPTSVDPEDRVVGYDDREVRGDIDEDAIASILTRAGRAVDFVFERPIHRYEIALPLQERRLPIGAIAVFVVALALMGWAARSGQRADGPEDRSLVFLFAVTSLALAWAMTLLMDPHGALADPWVLLPGVFAFALCRPLALEVHRRLGGGRSLVGTVIVLAPGVAVGLLGVWLGVHLLAASWGGTVAPGREGQVIDLIRAAAGLVAVYHVADVALTFSRRGGGGRAMRWSRIGLVVASLAWVSALLYGVQDYESFMAGGFVVHVAGHLLIVWFADLGVLVMPVIQPVRAPERPLSVSEARASVEVYMEWLATALRPDEPMVVVVRGKRACAVVRSGAVEPVDDVVRDAIGVLRDEGVSFPVPFYKGEEPTVGVEVARGVAQSVGLTTAFTLTDEGWVSTDHAERESSLYAYCVARGTPTQMDLGERHELVTAFGDVWLAFRILAVDWMLGPGPVSGVQASKSPRIVDLARAPVELGYLRRDIAMEYPVDVPGLLGADLERAVEDLGRDDAPAIVLGPAGAGKEFVARGYHRATGAGAFIKFPVSATPPSLLAMELLGDEASGREGHVTAARGGVLYIEDAGELSDELVHRLMETVNGSPRLVFGVRMDAGAQLGGVLGKLAKGSLAGRVVCVGGVGDSERMRSIVDHYLLMYAMKHNKFVPEAGEEVHAYLAARRWVGGVREIRSAIEFAVLRSEGEALSILDFEGSPPEGASHSVPSNAVGTPATENLGEALHAAQSAIYREALRRSGGNKAAAARLLGLNRSTFASRLKALVPEHGAM